MKDSRTDPIKRKIYIRNKYISGSSSEDEDDLFYLVDFKKTRHISICSSNAIKISKNNEKEGQVKHLGKWHEVKIVTMGTEERCLEKSKKYAEKLSISSSDDSDINKKRKHIENICSVCIN